MDNQEQIVDAIALLKGDKVKEKFNELLGNNGPQFLTSVISIVSQNDALKNADPTSVYLCAVCAATLDLPIGPLGFAHIIPYKKDGKQFAQFQIGYKGLIQLALRSGQFKTIGACPVYDGQIKYNDPLRGVVFDWDNKKSDEAIGYAAYFSLINGFEKTLYMTSTELKEHGLKFSQTFKKGYGLRKDDFDSMATKTVLKLLIGKYAPMSIQMQKAVIADQAIIKDEELIEVDYVDNIQGIESKVEMDEELKTHLIGCINACKNKKELNEWVKQNKPTNKEILSYIYEYGKTLQN